MDSTIADANTEVPRAVDYFRAAQGARSADPAARAAAYADLVVLAIRQDAVGRAARNQLAGAGIGVHVTARAADRESAP